MALTINPAVCGARHRWFTHWVVFAIGTLIGSLIALVLVIAVGDALEAAAGRTTLRAVLAAGTAWAALHDLGVPLPLPYRQRQVPEWLRDALPQGVVAFVFGVMLGVGFLTLFTYSAHAAMLASLPILSSLRSVLVVLATFAVAKSLVLATAAGTRSLDQVSGRFHWTPHRQQVLRLLTAAVSLLVFVALLIS